MCNVDSQSISYVIYETIIIITPSDGEMVFLAPAQTWPELAVPCMCVIPQIELENTDKCLLEVDLFAKNWPFQKWLTRFTVIL